MHSRIGWVIDPTFGWRATARRSDWAGRGSETHRVQTGATDGNHRQDAGATP